jgi:hypothetical protein
MVYEVGKWTKSTTKLLEFIKTETEKGIKLELRDIPAGTFRNWFYPLKNGGYIIEKTEEGYKLSESGITLLNSLLKNPPRNRKGKRTSYREMHQREREAAQEDFYELSLRGKDTVFQRLLTKIEADEVIGFVSQLRNKKK